MAHAWAVAFSVGRRNWFMASIERTVYPRFTRAPSVKELREIYTPTPTDVAFVATKARGPAQKFALMILLKVYQRLHYFPDPQSIPGALISHIRAVMNLPNDLVPDISPATLYRYYGVLREHLELNSQGKHARHVAAQAMHAAAQVMENPADLINAAIETLLVAHCELPAFSTLDRIAWRIRRLVNRGIYQRVFARIAEAEQQALSRLLEPDESSPFTTFDRIKDAPKSATLTHLDEWLNRLSWLQSWGTTERFVEGVRYSKITRLAQEARSLYPSDLLDFSAPRRLTLLARLLSQATVSTKDEIIQMFLKRMSKLTEKAKQELLRLREEERAITEHLIEVFADVVQASTDAQDPTDRGMHIREVLDREGGEMSLLEQCEQVSAHHGDRYQPFLKKFYGSHRKALFRVIKTLDLRSTTSDQTLVDAMNFIMANEHNPKQYLEATLDLSFTNKKGQPSLKRLKAKAQPAGLLELEEALHAKIPERHLLDVVVRIERLTGFGRHLGPLSGNEPKADDAWERQILAIFAYGTNLGPHQMARHLRGTLNAEQIAHINRRHITAEKLDAALHDVKNCFNRYTLPHYWGDEKRAASDGIQYELAEENLLAEKHIRYGGFGGSAYHPCRDMYILLFSHFIGCGVHEAIYLLDGLIRNRSDIKPSVLHADTHGQNLPVFGLSFLLGIELMPRIRNWKDLRFYRPSKEVVYEHIDSLFHDNVIDWNLIETHWQDLLQVVISIQEGCVLPSMLLRKLGTSSRKNRLYQAFYALGCVVRTVFLLTMISDVKLREVIHRATNKMEQYNALEDWVRFARGGVMYEHAFDEQEKQVKYTGLLTNCVILDNTVEISAALNALAQEGYLLSIDEVAALSPYQTRHIKRFGNYEIDFEAVPTLNADDLTFTLEPPSDPSAIETVQGD